MDNSLYRFLAQSRFLFKGHGIAGTFHDADATPFAIVVIDIPPSWTLVAHYRKVRTKQAAVVALVAETAIEAAFSLLHGQIG